MAERPRIVNAKFSIPLAGGNVNTATSYSFKDDRRKSRQERGYGAHWDKLRKQILERDQYICQCEDCKRLDRIRPATEVDHITSKAEWRINNGSIEGVDNPRNLQAINKECHKAKTAQEQRRAYGRD